jgi:hypothetical protein
VSRNGSATRIGIESSRPSPVLSVRSLNSANRAGKKPDGTKSWAGIPEDKYQFNYGAVGSLNYATGGPIAHADEHCNICNPFQYDSSIPLIVVSPFTGSGHIWHAYADHLSILKFICA